MSDVELRLVANLDQATKEVSGFRKEYAEMVRAVEKPIRQVQALQQTQEAAKAASSAFFAAKKRVDELKTAIAAAGQPVRALDRDLGQAQRTLASTTREFEKQKAKVREQRAELRAAGVDTRKLATEQQRLQSELAGRIGSGRNDAAIQGALQSLGVSQFRGTREAIAEQQRQFELLRKSGVLSTTEIAVAQTTLRQSIAAASRETQGLTAVSGTWLDVLGRIRGEVIAGAAAFGGFAMLARSSFSDYAEFEQQVAGIATITDLTGTQLEATSQQVRQISTDLGKPAAESAAALRDILGSGVETAKAMDVLAQSTKAAIAGMTDTKTAASVGVSIINAYGEDVGKLGERYDQLFLTIQDGVVEFDELAAGLGQVLPSAAAAGVGFDEIGAAIARMTVQGIKAPIAITGLRSAINQLAAPSPEAAKAMEELGIRWNGLSGTLQQIAQKKLGATAMRQIIPDTEGRTAVLALTNQIGAFNEQLGRMDQAAGSTERAYDIMKDTPQAQMDRFNASLGELKLAFGEAVAAGLPVINLLTGLLNAFNSLPEGLRVSLVGLVAFGAGAKAVAVIVKGLRSSFAGFLGTLGQAPSGAQAAGVALDGLAGSMGRLGKVRLASVAKGAGLLSVVGFTADQLSELYGLYKEMQQLEKSQASDQAALTGKATATRQYADVVIQSADAVKQQTETERNEYTKQLRLAEQHWRAQAELISRADMEQNGPTAPVSQEALSAAKQARAYQTTREAIQAELDSRAKSESAFTARIGKIKDDELKIVRDKLSQQLIAYDEANTRLEASRKAREGIQKEFAKLAAEMAGGTAATGGNSFADLSQAKYNARSAVRSGDSETALAEARRAAQIMKELKAAGANTYGFEGIAKELGQIADQAAKIDEQNAQGSLDEEKAKVDGFLQYAQALKRISVGYQSDAESEEQTKQRLIALAQQWAQYLQVPVTYVATNTANDARADGLIDPTTLPAKAAGGLLRGPGSGTSDSILARVSNGEFVMRAAAVRHYGPQLLSQLNAMRLPKFAAGGQISTRAMPTIPALAPSLAAAAGGSSGAVESWGTLALELGGKTYNVKASRSTAEDLRIEALKFGRTHRK